MCLFFFKFSFLLLHNIEQSSLCYTVGACWLSILYFKKNECGIYENVRDEPFGEAEVEIQM